MEANRLRMRKAAHERAEAGERAGGIVLVVEADCGRHLGVGIVRRQLGRTREEPLGRHAGARSPGGGRRGRSAAARGCRPGRVLGSNCGRPRGESGWRRSPARTPDGVSGWSRFACRHAATAPRRCRAPEEREPEVEPDERRPRVRARELAAAAAAAPTAARTSPDRRAPAAPSSRRRKAASGAARGPGG